jgi:hypothetical protein
MEKAAAQGNERAQQWLVDNAQEPLHLVSIQDEPIDSDSSIAQADDLITA